MPKNLPIQRKRICIPVTAVTDLEEEIMGLMHGIATLTIHIKDGRLIRYTTSRDHSSEPQLPTTENEQINIPQSAICALESEMNGLAHGTATLTLYIEDEKLTRYTTMRNRSFISRKPMTGSQI